MPPRILLSWCLCCPLLFGAAAAADLAGRWDGAAEIPGAAPMAIVLDLARDGSGRWVGSAVLPGRGVKGAALADLAVGSDSVSASLGEAIPSFGAPGAPAGVKLALQPDGSLRGHFTQGGHQAPLRLVRSGDPQPDLPQANTPVSPALGGTWTGSYELGGYPRQVTLVLTPGSPAAAALTIVGRRTTQVSIDRIVQGPRFITLESSALGLGIDGRYSDNQISGRSSRGRSKRRWC